MVGASLRTALSPRCCSPGLKRGSASTSPGVSQGYFSITLSTDDTDGVRWFPYQGLAAGAGCVVTTAVRGALNACFCSGVIMARIFSPVLAATSWALNVSSLAN